MSGCRTRLHSFNALGGSCNSLDRLSYSEQTNVDKNACGKEFLSFGKHNAACNAKCLARGASGSSEKTVLSLAKNRRTTSPGPSSKHVPSECRATASSVHAAEDGSAEASRGGSIPASKANASREVARVSRDIAETRWLTFLRHRKYPAATGPSASIPGQCQRHRDGQIRRGFMAACLPRAPLA